MSSRKGPASRSWLYQGALRAAAGGMAAWLWLGAPGGAAAAPAVKPTVSPAMARQRLARAIDRYQSGHLKQAGFYLAAATVLDPHGMAKSADAHKLRAFLLLADDRPGRAADSLVRSLHRRPDPFLFYLLGHFNLNMRSLPQALNSYRAARRTLANRFKRGGRIKDPILRRYLPYQCPVPGKDGGAGWLKSQRYRVFADPHRAAELWNRSLHPLELVAATHQAWVLVQHLQPQATARQSQLEGALEGYIKAGYLNATPVPGVAELIRKRNDVTAYQNCLVRLRQLQSRQTRRLRLGSSNPTGHNLKIIRQARRSIHRLLVGRFGNVASYYAYGSFSLRNGNPYEALHLLRRALEKSPLSFGPKGIIGDTARRAQIYRELSATYRKLRRPDDARTTRRLARALEDSLSGGSGPRPIPVAESILRLIQAGRANLHNREGLLLLIGYARTENNAADVALYRRKLRERDARTEFKELRAAFRNL